jgi:hypothetical protein
MARVKRYRKCVYAGDLRGGKGHAERIEAHDSIGMVLQPRWYPTALLRSG